MDTTRSNALRGDVADRPAPASATLGKAVARGVRWKLVSQVSAQITTAVTSVALAHLLSPGEFGLAGMALVFTGLGRIFSDLALSAALVQRKEIGEADSSTAFWTNVVAGVLLTLIGVGVSPFVADFFSRPKVGALFAAASTLFLLQSLSVTQMALLTREMNFRSLELRTMISVFVGAAVAISLAAAGAGAWSIIAQALVTGVASVALLWRLSSWRPRRVYSWASLQDLGSFSAKTFVSQLLGYLGLNMDNLLVGRYLGATPLGVYSVSYTTMFLPVARISTPIQQVFFSALAKLQGEPERLREGWARGNQLISAVNLPAFIGMAVVAPDFVPVVLGHKWHAAVPVLQLLSLAGVCTTLQTLNWSVVQATGRAGVMLRLRLFSAALTIAAFAFGLRWGVVGVAGLFAAARLVIAPVQTFVTCRTLGFSMLEGVRGELLILTLSVAMGVVAYGVRAGLVQAEVPSAARLAVLVLVGAGVYSALLFWRAPTVPAQIRAALGRRS